MSLKTTTGSLVDLESLKALVTQPGQLKKGDQLAKEGSVKLLPQEKRKRGSSFRQVLAALFANLGTINTGMAFGFSAVAIPQLMSPDSILPINEEQSSWIASLSSVTTPIGCIVSGYLMDAFGRRKILIMTQFPMIAGWLLIACANSLPMIYIGRLLVGFGSGMVGAPARVYTAEATQPHLRGMLAALASVGVSLGVTIEYSLGAAVSWQMLALLSSIVPTLALIGSFFLPESPSWLMSNGKVEKSKASLVKLRGPTCDIDYEADQLQAFAEKNNIHKPSFKETLRAILHPSAIKPFIILTLYFLIYQFSGVNSVTFYAVEVFEESGASINKYLATVILGIVRLFFTIAACVCMRRCGRRPLTFISSVGCGISMLGLGTYMFLNVGWKAAGEPAKATSFPVACIMFFTAASTIGYLVVPWVMIGEVYPTQVRGIIGGMTTCCAHFCVFLVVKTFPLLQVLISKHGVFWLYGAISLTGTLFFFYFLPETKGRSLQEIEDYFSGRTKTLAPPPKEKPPKVKRNHPIILKAQKGEALP